MAFPSFAAKRIRQAGPTWLPVALLLCLSWPGMPPCRAQTWNRMLAGWGTAELPLREPLIVRGNNDPDTRKAISSVRRFGYGAISPVVQPAAYLDEVEPSPPSPAPTMAEPAPDSVLVPESDPQWSEPPLPGQSCSDCGMAVETYTPFSLLQMPVDLLHRIPTRLPYCGGQLNHPLRANGWGQPLVGTSWLNRPVHIGWFFGGIAGDTLIPGVAGQESDLFGGYRFGWDFDHYWGTELRYGMANVQIDDGPWLETTANPDLYEFYPHDCNYQFFDTSLVFYPWGDSAWRPFVSVGVGVAEFRFTDVRQIMHREALFQMPFSAGVKYHMTRWCVFRVEATDNLAFGTSDLATMHNISYTFGVEVHCGGRPQSYYPWSPSIRFW